MKEKLVCDAISSLKWMDALSKGQPVNVKSYKPFACIGKLILDIDILYNKTRSLRRNNKLGH